MSDHAAVTPISVRADAISRAMRTLYIAFGADALVLIGAGLLVLVEDVDISSKAFWIGLGVLVVKSVLTSLGSYLLRLKKAPPAEQQREALIPAETIPAK